MLMKPELDIHSDPASLALREPQNRAVPGHRLRLRPVMVSTTHHIVTPAVFLWNMCHNKMMLLETASWGFEMGKIMLTETVQMSALHLFH